jgi:cysteine desulfurase
MFNFFKKKRIYFDRASAVPVLEIAKKSFLNTINKSFANASSIHFEGEQVKEILFEARKKVAKFIKSKLSEIYFTSSTTEANNLYIKGVALSEKKIHIIYSESDHSAIVEVVKDCVKFGAEISSVTPNKIGVLKVEDILKEIKSNTRLICFSYVSSELGTIQEVRKISLAVQEYCKNNNWPRKSWPKIFIDATQAAIYENMDVSTLLVDGLSFSGAKMGSVSGCAVLFARRGVKLETIISGGGQEEGFRSGTENLGAIVALGEVLNQQKSNKEDVYSLRHYCIEKLRENFTDQELEIFGDTKFKHNSFFENAAPHILLLSLVDMLGEETLLRLDAKGISVSTASACSLLENSGSNFLKSIKEPVKAKETIRLSFGEKNTKQEIDYFVKVLREIKDKFI